MSGRIKKKKPLFAHAAGAQMYPRLLPLASLVQHPGFFLTSGP